MASALRSLLVGRSATTSGLFRRRLHCDAASDHQVAKKRDELMRTCVESTLRSGWPGDHLPNTNTRMTRALGLVALNIFCVILGQDIGSSVARLGGIPEVQEEAAFTKEEDVKSPTSYFVRN
uniref:Uncharacterized protein n=1 Tax=Oryza punctata TaxID=4537 RepID=A0A0E0LGB4_ORYPU